MFAGGQWTPRSELRALMGQRRIHSLARWLP
eukprot:CAMPEP_0117588566 /NCGR_PEP_ID=MMETSP0784-20121206/69924_1 /TAXON_ID=39447 /ORGANISM="" /LENGTH=30 /DNA_ID= /DNA_START= /DNA_END= /DNA_ORIENTATION=